jgi:hypothetical protein
LSFLLFGGGGLVLRGTDSQKFTLIRQSDVSDQCHFLERFSRCLASVAVGCSGLGGLLHSIKYCQKLDFEAVPYYSNESLNDKNKKLNLSNGTLIKNLQMAIYFY